MTIYDIAKEAGVSASTVSRVINGKPGIGEKTRKKKRHDQISLLSPGPGPSTPNRRWYPFPCGKAVIPIL